MLHLLMIVLLVGPSGGDQGQSLGAVAAKEKERRAKTASKKPFTESDLQDAANKRAAEGGSSSNAVPPSPGSPPPSTAAPSSPAPSDPAGIADSTQSDAAKKARGADYKARLEAVNAQLKRAEENLAAAESDWRIVSNHPTELAAATDKARARLEAARTAVQALRRQRDDLEDAARREGIPPGYMR